MIFDKYQEVAKEFLLEECKNNSYLALGLNGEAGEVAELIKKQIRGDTLELNKTLLRKELGDVLWYLSALAEVNGLSLSEIASENITKLLDRKVRNKIKGSGDLR